MHATKFNEVNEVNEESANDVFRRSRNKASNIDKTTDEDQAVRASGV